MTRQNKKAKTARSVAVPAKKSKLSFFSDAMTELKKAHWPTRQEALRLSLLVLIICVVVGAILGAIDYGFTKLLANLLPSG